MGHFCHAGQWLGLTFHALCTNAVNRQLWIKATHQFPVEVDMATDRVQKE